MISGVEKNKIKSSMGVVESRIVILYRGGFIKKIDNWIKIWRECFIRIRIGKVECVLRIVIRLFKGVLSFEVCLVWKVEDSVSCY